MEEKTTDNSAAVPVESEFITANQCGQESVYLREIPKRFGAVKDSYTRVFEDNQPCVTMS